MSDLKAPRPAPSRVEVAAQWRALVAGDVTREAVHSWAASWVEVEEGFCDGAPLVFGALQRLHGFDLRREPCRPGVVWHGTAGEGEWVHSLDDIVGGFASWQEMCDLHDTDPRALSQAEDED